MATYPMNIRFTTTSADYDLLADTVILDGILKHYGSSVVDSIKQGNVQMNVTVFVDSETKIKFDLNDNYQEFIMRLVYSSNGYVYPKHIYIQDSSISGMLSIQIA